MLSLKHVANYNQSFSSVSGLTSLKSLHLCRQITSYEIKFRPAALNIKSIPWGCNTKALFIALLMSLLNRRLLPHSVKRLIYSMSSPLLHFHFLHCRSASLKPPSPTETTRATQLCKLHRPGLVKGCTETPADMPKTPRLGNTTQVPLDQRCAPLHRAGVPHARRLNGFPWLCIHLTLICTTTEGMTTEAQVLLRRCAVKTTTNILLNRLLYNPQTQQQDQ